jgi:hypothetical protein
VLTGLFRGLVGVDSMGTLWIEYFSYKLVALLSKVSPNNVVGSINSLYMTFCKIGYVTGFLYVFLVFFITSTLKGSNLFKLSLAVGVISCGGILFYFGYVEYYAIMYLFGTLFVLTGLKEVGEFPKYSLICFVVAMMFHQLCFVFFPAMVALFMFWRKIRVNYVLITMSVFLLICLGYYLSQDHTTGETFFLTWVSCEKWGIGIFSAQHILDIINVILLISPVTILLGIVVFKIKKDPVVIFVLICVIFWTAFSLSSRALLARNWDIFALWGVVATVLLVISVKTDKFLLSQIAVQSLLFVLPWVYLNSLSHESSERFNSITALYMETIPKGWTQSHLETQRKYYSSVQDFDGEIYIITTTIDLTNDSYEYIKLIRTLSSFEQSKKMLSQESTRHILMTLSHIVKQDMSQMVVVDAENDVSRRDLWGFIIKKTHVLSDQSYRKELESYYGRIYDGQ